MNTNVNHHHWVIMMCMCKFTNYKMYHYDWHTGNGTGHAYVGARRDVGNPNVLLNFSESTTALNKTNKKTV